MEETRRIVLVFVLVAVVSLGFVSVLYVLTLEKGSSSITTTASLPQGCEKPPGGFLLVASNLGWNDSILHGAKATRPKITVKEGATVNMTICDTDVQPHSFEIAHYEQSAVHTLQPQQVLHFTFVADQVGTFQFYCVIPCSIHVYMQSGQLVVTP